jgi:hypothetical protein
MHTGYWITDEMKPNFLTDVKEQKKDWGFSSWNEVLRIILPCTLVAWLPVKVIRYQLPMMPFNHNTF